MVMILPLDKKAITILIGNYIGAVIYQSIIYCMQIDQYIIMVGNNNTSSRSSTAYARRPRTGLGITREFEHLLPIADHHGGGRP